MSAPKTLPGSFSGRMGRRWSRDGADYRARADENRLAHLDASPVEAVLPPSQAAMRRAIEAGLCPFCSAGPFKSVGAHTAKAHAVTADELRQMSGLKRICSEDLSERARRNLVTHPDFEERCKRGGALSPIGKGDPSWRATLEAHQDKRRAERDRRDPIIVARAAAGDRLMDIAADLGVTTFTVKSTLDRLDVPRPAGRQRWGRKAVDS